MKTGGCSFDFYHTLSYVTRANRAVFSLLFSLAPMALHKGEMDPTVALPGGLFFVPKLEFSEPRLKFSPARHPSTSTLSLPLSPTLLSYHHGQDTPHLNTHV